MQIRIITYIFKYISDACVCPFHLSFNHLILFVAYVMEANTSNRTYQHEIGMSSMKTEYYIEVIEYAHAHLKLENSHAAPYNGKARKFIVYTHRKLFIKCIPRAWLTFVRHSLKLKLVKSVQPFLHSFVPSNFHHCR